MIKLTLRRDSIRPNTSIPFYEYDSDDLAFYQSKINESLLLSIDESLSPDGLTLTRSWVFDITDPNAADTIYADSGFDTIASKTIAYDTNHGITRGLLTYSTTDDDDVEVDYGDFPEKP